MKAVLFRTGSVPVHIQSNTVSGWSRPCLPRSASVSGDWAGKGISVNCEINRSRSLIRRSMSETDISGGNGSFSARILEEDDDDRSRSVLLSRTATCFTTSWPELGSSGGGSGNGNNSGGGGAGGGDGGFGKRMNLGEYYEKMLKMNPGDPLLLRNYGKYLQEVVGDFAKAEMYYGRAILATNGGDGELLSLYGSLIWQTQRDEERAKSYFDQAVSASPDDCAVLGSYAHFMWDAVEQEDEERNANKELSVASPLVPAC